MKIRRFYYIVCSLLLLANISCNNSNAKNTSNVDDFKVEANYLTELAKENLSIINVCKTLDTLSLQEELKSTVDTIKEEQNKIQDNIKQLADNSIVLIANTTDEEYKVVDSLTEDTEEVKKALEFIQYKRERQLQILDSLEKIESDKRTKKVADDLKKTIQSNIYITKKTLERLK
ncbi:hypothetical protein ACFQ1Q_02040 [Winogradskyella litorisediminis]|uniref:DUF4142 domain-containing protein n=1 Tax=Winogradskyella litorisediminis TaxID=1156618 RepID=A0ABW3N2S4_9FLAO